jgi:hypothetical protein
MHNEEFLKTILTPFLAGTAGGVAVILNWFRKKIDISIYKRIELTKKPERNHESVFARLVRSS